MRWLDLLHARYHNDGFFFPDGWGDEELLKQSLVIKSAPEPIRAKPLNQSELHRVLRFDSPWSAHLPEASKVAEALLVLPSDWDWSTPVCVQLAATGDEGFETRRTMVAEPLKELGIASVILENPFYGSRKPREQQSTYLKVVSDLWVMGLAIVAEARALLGWLSAQGFQHLGAVGVSMGGAMVSQVAALSSEPLAVCACIAPHSAAPVFTEAVLSRYVDWEALGGEEEGKARLAKQLEGSDLRLFPLPKRPDCAIWLPAKHDAYVHRSSSLLAAESWPGSSVRWLNNSHVGSTMFHRNQYIKAIQEAFKRLARTQTSPGAWLP